LFMYLRQLGYDPTYSQIEQHVPAGPDGTCLLELRDAARKLGIRLEIRKREPNRRETLRLPQCIALISGKTEEGGTERFFKDIMCWWSMSAPMPSSKEKLI
jgi:ABC-type bacteriocin/lantibiotic exporter with double-glycine peptidase domain